MRLQDSANNRLKVHQNDVLDLLGATLHEQRTLGEQSFFSGRKNKVPHKPDPNTGLHSEQLASIISVNARRTTPCVGNRVHLPCI